MKKIKIIISSIGLLFFVYGYQACSPVEFSSSSSQVDLPVEEKKDIPTPPVVVPVVEKPICLKTEITQPDQAITDKLDILFAVDTSGSLNDLRPQISAQIGAFLTALPANIQVNVGVLLGHGNGQVNKSNFVGKLYQINAADPLVLSINADKSNLAVITPILNGKMVRETSPQFFSLDGDADGGEEVLYSLQQMFTPANLALAKAANFLRDDAGLAVIFIADEQDICARDANGVAFNPGNDPEEAAAFIRDCANTTPKAVVDAIVAEKTKILPTGQEIKYPLVMSAIVPLGVVPANQMPLGYLETIALNKGVLVDIFDPNFAVGLAKIGQVANTRLSLFSEHKLIPPAFTIDQASISVKIGDPLDPANRTPASMYTFDPATLLFTFPEIERGVAGEVIEINYCELKAP